MANAGMSYKLNTRAIRNATEEARERALVLAAEHVLGESNKRVPHEEGHLENSGAVVYDPANQRATISYTEPYAVVQHEDMTLRHDNGREAKYLENALNAEKGTINKIIAGSLRGDF